MIGDVGTANDAGTNGNVRASDDAGAATLHDGARRRSSAIAHAARTLR